MNRVIKFRGKRLDNGEWVYGDVYHGLNELIYINHVVVNDYKSRRNELTEVDPDTVGQFTGLHDKEGNEIYEGDIVSLHYFYEALGENLGVYEAEKIIKGELCFQELGLWINSNTEEDSGYLLWINGIHEESIKKTSNIHDNPELINE